MAYGFIIHPNCKSRCVKRFDLLVAGRLRPKSGTHPMGCPDEVHTTFMLLMDHDFGLGRFWTHTGKHEALRTAQLNSLKKNRMEQQG